MIIFGIAWSRVHSTTVIFPLVNPHKKHLERLPSACSREMFGLVVIKFRPRLMSIQIKSTALLRASRASIDVVNAAPLHTSH